MRGKMHENTREKRVRFKGSVNKLLKKPVLGAVLWRL